MLSFAKVTDTKTLLANANTLRDFTPFAKTNNTLSVNAFGEIVLSTRPLLPSHAFNPLVKLNIVGKEQQNSFAQEKMIILWHYAHMLSYLKQRLVEITTMPNDTLHAYYTLNATIHGFGQLCDSLYEQHINLVSLFYALEKTNAKKGTLLFRTTQKNLNNEMGHVFQELMQLQGEIEQQRKRLLTTPEVAMMQFMVLPDDELEPNEAPGIPINIINTWHLPCSYNVGRISVGPDAYQISASLVGNHSFWGSAKLNPFSGKLRVELVDDTTESHGTLEMYPSWTYGATPTPMATTAFHDPDDCAANMLSSELKNKKSGCIPLQLVNLKVRFYRVCDHVKSHQLLPYFVTLIDIAKAQHIPYIVFYAPYDQSAIMYSYGFRTCAEDVAEPTVEQQQAQVNTCYGMAQKVPTLNSRYNRQNEQGKELLRAFTFYLADIDSTPVYLPKKQEKTTYAKLLGARGVIDRQHYPNGIIPEVHQIPLRFDCPLYKVLREIELTGKTYKPILTLGVSKIDYTKLESNKALETYSFSEPLLANESKYTTLPTLTRNNYE